MPERRPPSAGRRRALEAMAHRIQDQMAHARLQTGRLLLQLKECRRQCAELTERLREIHDTLQRE